MHKFRDFCKVLEKSLMPKKIILHCLISGVSNSNAQCIPKKMISYSPLGNIKLSIDKDSQVETCLSETKYHNYPDLSHACRLEDLS